MVSPKPSIETYELSEHDYILFLASDGVWDNLEELEIYSAVRSFVTDNHIQGTISNMLTKYMI
jgi:serine/threonine protein phosphatase PrpC